MIVSASLRTSRAFGLGLFQSRKHSKAHVGRPAPNGKPVKIGPHEWPSIRVCARALGVGATTLRDKIRAGDSDWLLASVMAWRAREEGHKPRELILSEEYGQMIREKMEAARARAAACQGNQKEGAAA